MVSLILGIIWLYSNFHDFWKSIYESVNDQWCHFAISTYDTINQSKIFIKNLIYSKSGSNVAEDTSINYSTYLAIYLRNKSIYIKSSNAGQNMRHHKWIILYMSQNFTERKQSIFLGTNGHGTDRYLQHIELWG